MLSEGGGNDSRKNRVRKPHGWKPRENAGVEVGVTDRSMSLRAGESHLRCPTSRLRADIGRQETEGRFWGE